MAVGRAGLDNLWKVYHPPDKTAQEIAPFGGRPRFYKEFRGLAPIVLLPSPPPKRLGHFLNDWIFCSGEAIGPF